MIYMSTTTTQIPLTWSEYHYMIDEVTSLDGRYTIRVIEDGDMILADYFDGVSFERNRLGRGYDPADAKRMARQWVTDYDTDPYFQEELAEAAAEQALNAD